MDPNLSYLLIAHYLQDRMVEAESARSVREVKRATAHVPMPHRLLRRRFGRRSHDEVIVPTAAAGAVVPPSH